MLHLSSKLGRILPSIALSIAISGCVNDTKKDTKTIIGPEKYSETSTRDILVKSIVLDVLASDASKNNDAELKEALSDTNIQLVSDELMKLTKEGLNHFFDQYPHINNKTNALELAYPDFADGDITLGELDCKE